MSLFDLFRKHPQPPAPADRELAKLGKMLSSKLSQDVDRFDALDRLCKMGSGPAARVLLTRFSWNLDPSIRDQEEKAQAVEGIAKAGSAALGPIREYCVKAESLTWPLKALREIVKEAELEKELLTLLARFDTEYLRNPEPKVHLIQALEEFKTEETQAAVGPFVFDVSEAVRFAAVTCLFAIDKPAAAAVLAEALSKEESLRVKNRIAQGLAERRWTIPEPERESVASHLPFGFSVSDGAVQGAPLAR